MADKDWLKSFPRGYKKIVEHLEQGSYDFARIEMEKRISKKVEKNPHIINAIFQIASHLDKSESLFTTPSELNRISSSILGNISANRDMKNYVKDAVLLGVRQGNGDFTYSILNHFIGKLTEKEITERIFNTPPLEKEHGFTVNAVKQKMHSREFRQQMDSLKSDLTYNICSGFGNKKKTIDNNNPDIGRFNFFPAKNRGIYAN